MKHAFLLCSCLLWLLPVGSAQTLVVNPGPVGTLNQAIANNPGVTTFVLKRNFPYLLSGELNITAPLTIKAEDGPGKRPILIYAPPSGAPNIEQIIRTSAHLRLEGLHLTNRDNLGGLSQRIIRIIGDDLRIETHDCIFDDSGQTVFRLDGKNIKLYTTGCLGTRLGQPNNPDNGRYIDDRGNLVDTIVIENCAIYHVTSRIIRDGGESINHLRIQGSTFMNTHQRGFEIGKVREFIFLNNICADLQFTGRDSSLNPANNTTSASAAWIRIDSTGQGGENWIIGYSNFFYTPELLDYYKFPFRQGSGDTVVPVSFFTPTVERAIDAGGWRNTIISEPLRFRMPPPFQRSYVDTLHFGSVSNARPWDMGSLAPDPIYSQLPVGTNRYSTLHDFNYDCSAQSNTAGLNGVRLGAQLWGDCFVSARDLFTEHGVLFYPNPATDALYLSGVARLAQVQLFSLDGRPVRTLRPGANWVEIPLHDLPPGIYLVALVDERGHISTRKLIRQ